MPYCWPRAPALDGLRALAAIAILVYHVWIYTKPVPLLATTQAGVTGHLLGQARLGIAMFFVLSGYLLFRPFVSAVLERSAPPSLRDYALRRAARILPCYYVVLIAAIVLLWPHPHTPGVRLPDSAALLPLFAVFGQNFADGSLMRLDPPMWTLTIEVTFYAALPLLSLWALRRARTRGHLAAFATAVVAAGVLYNAVTALAGVPDPLIKILPAMLPDFGAGMLAAALLHGRRVGRGACAALLAAAVVLVGGEAAYSVVLAQGGSHEAWLPMVRDLPAAIGFAALVAVAAHGAFRLRPLDARPLVYLGTISYGFYLWHEPLMLYLRAHGLLPLDTLAATPLVIAASAAVSAASWHLLERPVMRLARSRRSSRAGSPAAEPARRYAASSSSRDGATACAS